RDEVVKLAKRARPYVRSRLTELCRFEFSGSPAQFWNSLINKENCASGQERCPDLASAGRVGIGPLAENGRTDAYLGGALGNGQREIAAHAHRKPRQHMPQRRRLVAAFAQAAEAAADL